MILHQFLMSGRHFMPLVTVEEEEPIDITLRRFKKECDKAGIMSEIKKREFFEKPSARKKQKLAASRRKKAKKIKRYVSPYRK